MLRKRFGVVVRNIGCVYYGDDALQAQAVFHNSVTRSQAKDRPWAGEPVVLWDGNQILKEWGGAGAARADSFR